MPLKITVMGIDRDRVTFGISASFRGTEIHFHQTTFSMTPGDELNLVMYAKLENGSVIGEGELIAEPDGPYLPGVQSLYDVEPS